jgi:hypothetical protein
MLPHWSLTIQFCSPSRLHRGATAFGLTALLLVLACGRHNQPSSSALSHTDVLLVSHVGHPRCRRRTLSYHVDFLWDLPGEVERSHRVGFLAVRPFDSSAEGGRDFLSLTLTRSVYCACLRPPTGRANRALVLGVLSGVAHLIL